MFLENVSTGNEKLVEDKRKRLTKKVYIETYGCQMNVSDSEIVASVLSEQGYAITNNLLESDVVLINTCSIREKAEQLIRKRLTDFNKLKVKNANLIIGILGCMAERLKQKLLEEEKLVDLIAGPDAYRDISNLLLQVEITDAKAVNVILSKEETYADISPVSLAADKITAYISITRGCDNMCTFCVVPFTRGRERSREPETILQEAQDLFDRGIREVTLLGQNVDSYLWYGKVGLRKEYDTLDENERRLSVNLAQLLKKVAQISPLLRVRFSTSHPKDISDELIKTIAKYDNICNAIHLPFQSGSDRILDLMNRGYSSEWYKNRIKTIKKYIPDCGLSTDIITGFCTEREEDHQATLDMMNHVIYDFAYMFNYSERPGTLAQRKLKDDVTDSIKSKRLSEVIRLQGRHSLIANKTKVGKVFRVLIEGVSKKSDNDFSGRNSQNTVVVFPKNNAKKGDYVDVLITDCTQATLLGKIVNS